jgi:excisionase family DNA binding protein
MRSKLSPKQLAAAIGVSESSLKRWADSGRLIVTRTIGGHRRIDLQEALRFVRESGLQVQNPEKLGLSPEVHAPPEMLTGDSAVLLKQLLIEGRIDDAKALLLRMFMEGRSVAWMCDGPIRDAVDAVGEIWRRREPCGVFLEHLATNTIQETLTQILQIIRPDGKTLSAEPAALENGSAAKGDESPPIAVGGAPPGDPFTLPSLMAACVMAEAGYREVNLGADLPFDALFDAVDTYEPRLAWLAFTGRGEPVTAGRLERVADRLRERGTALAVGGRAVPPHAKRSNSFRTCQTMAELSAFAQGLVHA